MSGDKTSAGAWERHTLVDRGALEGFPTAGISQLLSSHVAGYETLFRITGVR